jgi:hypothetical protein
VNPTDYLRLGVEQYLRELPDDEYNELVQRVRPPDDEPEPAGSDTSAFLRQMFGRAGD